MKKVLLLSLIIITIFSMTNCGPNSMTPNATIPGSIELLFDLPSDVEVVSEEFVFEMDIAGYSDWCFSPPMLVTSTYVIRNNGESQNFNIGLPFISSIYMYDDKMSETQLIVDDESIDFEWKVTTDGVESLEFEEINYSYFDSITFDNDDYTYDGTIYKYEFNNPKDELDETASFSINQFSKILCDGACLFYEDKGTITNKDKSDVTVIYSLNNEVSIDFNYDSNLVVSELSLDELTFEIDEDKVYQLIVKKNILDFLQSDSTRTMINPNDDYLFTDVYKDATKLIFFSNTSIELTGGGTETTIQVVYPFWASYDKTDNVVGQYALVYNFYFDDSRYQDEDIDIEIIIQSDYQFSNLSIGENQELLMFDPIENNHLQFKTLN